MKYTPDYSKFETLKNYALWYYLRYYPSVWKLVKKLEQKTQNKKDIEKLLVELKDDFREEYILEYKIDELIKKWKSERFIIQKLSLSFFKKEDIEKILEEKYAIWGWVLETDGANLSIMADMVDDWAWLNLEEIKAKKEEAKKLMNEMSSTWKKIDMDRYIELEMEYLRESAKEQLAIW